MFLVILMLTLFGGLSIRPVSAATLVFTEYQITSNSTNQQNPDFYHYSRSDFIIIWQDNRNGNWDIYAYAPFLNAWQPEIRITSNPANQVNPKVYADMIVYQDDRNGNWDIYAYNITSKVESQITSNQANQDHPAIHDNKIVYQDDRYGYWSVYLYDLTVKTETLFATYYSAPINCYSPQIYGDKIVYIESYAQGYGAFSYFLKCRDLATGIEQIVAAETRGFGGIESPSIYENYVAWAGAEIYLWDIGVKDVSTGTMLYNPLTSSEETNPAISGNYVVYQRQPILSAYTNLFLYNIEVGQEYRVTNNVASQLRPSICTEIGKGNTIVYMDNRNGNWDIYYTSFGYVVTGGGGGTETTIEYYSGQIESTYDSPRRVTESLQTLKDQIADTSQMPTNVFEGTNHKVKENRRNAILNQIDSALTSFLSASNTQDLKIRQTQCQNTIDQLNELLCKTDGYVLRGAIDSKGSRYTPDWITDDIAQDKVFGTINYCLMEMRSLLENIGSY